MDITIYRKTCRILVIKNVDGEFETVTDDDVIQRVIESFVATKV